MSVFIKRFIVISLTLGLAGGALAEELNWVSVDMEAIFQGYYKTIKADGIIKKQTEIYREYAINLEKERGSLQDTFNGLRNESQNIALSEEVRDSKREEAQTKFMLLQEKKKEIQEYQQDKRLNLRQQYEEQRAVLVNEISDVVKVYSEQQGYTLVIDSSGNTLNGLPAFIYLKSEMDITDTILAMINKGHEDKLEKEKEFEPEKITEE